MLVLGLGDPRCLGEGVLRSRCFLFLRWRGEPPFTCMFCLVCWLMFAELPWTADVCTLIGAMATIGFGLILWQDYYQCINYYVWTVISPNDLKWKSSTHNSLSIKDVFLLLTSIGPVLATSKAFNLCKFWRINPSKYTNTIQFCSKEHSPYYKYTFTTKILTITFKTRTYLCDQTCRNLRQDVLCRLTYDQQKRHPKLVDSLRFSPLEHHQSSPELICLTLII